MGPAGVDTEGSPVKGSPVNVKVSPYPKVVANRAARASARDRAMEFFRQGSRAVHGGPNAAITSGAVEIQPSGPARADVEGSPVNVKVSPYPKVVANRVARALAWDRAAEFLRQRSRAVHGGLFREVGGTSVFKHVANTTAEGGRTTAFKELAELAIITEAGGASVSEGLEAKGAAVSEGFTGNSSQRGYQGRR